MKAKTIKSVISNKINDWLSSIDDSETRKLATKNTIVTGGCIASMLLNEKVNDYDLYFRDHETARVLAEYYVNKFKENCSEAAGAKSIFVCDDGDRIKIKIQSAGIASENENKPYQFFETRADGEAGEYVGVIMEDVIDDPTSIDPDNIEDVYIDLEEKALECVGKPKYRPVFLSTNAITLSNKIQLVLRFFGEPDEIHANYDYIHCTNYWQSWDGHLELRKGALESLLSRELFYVGSKYPVCSIFRLRKFIRRGWTINAGQILKILLQVSDLDLTNFEVLQDQLTGVDCAYFTEILNKVSDKYPDKINSAYLIEIIDRMF
jgi:hypothetical protein